MNINQKLSSICFLNKPADMSSMQVVKKMKQHLQKIHDLNKQEYKTLKIGHAGTLDPFATGVLPICVGTASKLTDIIHTQDKTYRFQVIFGSHTNTGDKTGNITQVPDAIYPTKQAIINILPQFTGIQEQTPHAFSAVHINGQRAYKLARGGQTFEIPSKMISVSFLSLEFYSEQNCTFIATCSKGTYIRKLAEDIAKALGTCCYVTVLERVQYVNQDADEICTLENPIFHPLSLLLRSVPHISLNSQHISLIEQGKNRILEIQDNIYILTDEALNVIALIRIENNYIKTFRKL